MFKADVDGCKSDLDEYARRLLMCSLTYGQSHILVDYPAPGGAVSLAEERSQNRRPYWIEVDPTNIYGWRLDREVNYGSLIQVRIAEKAVVPSGEFGEQVFDQVRVIEPGKYRVYRKASPKKDLINLEDESYSGNFDGPEDAANLAILRKGMLNYNNPQAREIFYDFLTEEGASQHKLRFDKYKRDNTVITTDTDDDEGGFIRTKKIGVVAAGHSSVIANMAGL